MKTALGIFASVIHILLALCFSAAGTQQKDAPAFDLYGDPLPEGAVARLGTVRFRHDPSIMALAYSPDGKVLASAGITIGLCLWDAATGRPLHQLHAHNDVSTCLAFSPDGKTVLTGTSLCLVDVATGKTIRVFDVTNGDIDYLTIVAFSPDGKTIAGGGRVGKTTKIILWDVASGKELRRLVDINDGVASLAFSPDGKTLVSGSREKVTRIWDVKTGNVKKRLEAHEGIVRCLAFSADGQSIVTADDGGFVWTWNMNTGKLSQKLTTGEKEGILSIGFSRDGMQVAFAAKSGAVGFFDTSNGTELRRFVVHHRSPEIMAFSPDLKVLVSAGGLDSDIRRWNTETGKELDAANGHTGRIYRLQFSSDRKRLFSFGNDLKLLEWDLATAHQRAELFGRVFEPRQDGWGLRALDLAPDCKRLAWSDGDLVVHVWDTLMGREHFSFGPLDGLFSVQFSPDGKVLASCDNNGLRLWSLATGKQLHHSQGIPQTGQLLFAPDSKLLAGLGFADIMLWDVASGKMIKTWQNRAGQSGASIAFSPEGKLLHFRGDGDEVTIWNPDSGKDLVRLKGFDLAGARAISPSGRVLAAARLAHAAPPKGESVSTYPINLWDLFSGQEIQQLFGYQVGIQSLAFSRDGRTLASGGNDSTILLWDLVNDPKEPKLKPGPISDNALTPLWSDLAGDARKADRAIWKLAFAPQQSVPFLNQRLQVAPAPADQVAKLIADLDSAQYAVRQKAAKALDDLGGAAEAALRKALTAKLNLEVRRRVELILENRDKEVIRQLRAIESLEHAGTAEARRVLEALAKSAPNPRVAEAAGFALRRLASD